MIQGYNVDSLLFEMTSLCYLMKTLKMTSLRILSPLKTDMKKPAIQGRVEEIIILSSDKDSPASASELDWNLSISRSASPSSSQQPPTRRWQRRRRRDGMPGLGCCQDWFQTPQEHQCPDFQE